MITAIYGITEAFNSFMGNKSSKSSKKEKKEVSKKRDDHRIEIAVLGCENAGVTTLCKKWMLVLDRNRRINKSVSDIHYSLLREAKVFVREKNLVCEEESQRILRAHCSGGVPMTKEQCVAFALVNESMEERKLPKDLVRMICDMNGGRISSGLAQDIKKVCKGGYFVDNIDRICAKDYEMTNDDYIRAKEQCQGMRSFTFAQASLDHILYDLSGVEDKKQKLFELSPKLTAFCFVLDMTDTKRIDEAVEMFESITSDERTKNVCKIVCFNKQDLFKEQKEQLAMADERFANLSYRNSALAKKFKDGAEVLHYCNSLETSYALYKSIHDTMIDFVFNKFLKK